MTKICYNLTKGGFMEPYKAQLFPIEYKISRDIVKLLGEANDKYGQFKTLLQLLIFILRDKEKFVAK